VSRALVLLFLLAGTAIAGPTRPKQPPAPAPAPAPEPPPPAMPGANDPRKIIGILDVRIDGAPPEIGAQFMKDLDAQVDPKHYFLAPRALMHEIMANSTRWTDGCVVGPCLQELRTQTRAAIVLLASLTGSGTSFGWVITLVRTDSGNVLSQRAERCDVCTVDEALRNATRAAVDLLSAIPETLPDEHPKALPAAPAEVSDDRIAALHHTRHVTAATLLGVGVVALVAGTAVYYAENHSSTALGVAGAGIGLVVGGIITLTF
jgi:hypothetical protein